MEEHMETKLNGNGCGQAADELTGHQRHGKRHGRTDVRKCGRVHERQHGPDDKWKAVADTRPGMGRRMPRATAMPTVIRAATPATAALAAIFRINGRGLVRQA